MRPSLLTSFLPTFCGNILALAIYGISKEEFQEQWADYARQVKAIAAASNATRSVLSRSLQVERNIEIIQDRGTKAPYDGMVEIWWQNGNEIAAYIDSGTGDDDIDTLRRLQEAFMDLPNCTFFFAAEED